LECHAYPFVTCKTTCVTNGWFEYELTLHDDPFCELVDWLALETTQVTNALAVGPIPSGWTNEVSANSVSWSYPGIPFVPMSRPQVVHLSIQSPYTSFRWDPSALTVMFSGVFHDYVSSPVLSMNFVGFLRLAGLVPCPASEADGSPPTTTAVFESAPDINLTGFVTVSNQLRGVQFAWDNTFTMQVQTSRNLTSWSNVAYVVGDSGMNTWTSSIPLDQIGNYFRLRLYSIQKHPEMVQ
jgi:hypothetical protein